MRRTRPVARGRAALAALGDSGRPGELGRPAREAEPSEPCFAVRRDWRQVRDGSFRRPFWPGRRSGPGSCWTAVPPRWRACDGKSRRRRVHGSRCYRGLTVVLDEVCRAADVPEVSRLVHTARRVVCRNLSQISIARAAGTPFDVAAPLYAENAEAVAAFCGLGAARVWLPDEFDDASAARLAGELAQTGAPSGCGPAQSRAARAHGYGALPAHHGGAVRGQLRHVSAAHGGALPGGKRWQALSGLRGRARALAHL